MDGTEPWETMLHIHFQRDDRKGMEKTMNPKAATGFQEALELPELAELLLQNLHKYPQALKPRGEVLRTRDEGVERKGFGAIQTLFLNLSEDDFEDSKDWVLGRKTLSV